MLKLNKKIIKNITCFLAVTFVGSMGLNITAHAESNKVWKWVKFGPYNWSYEEVDAANAQDKGWVLDPFDLLWRYYNDDGSYKTGWFYDKGNWYYFHPSGIMAYNTKVNGYYINDNGAWTDQALPSVYTSYEVLQGITELGFNGSRGAYSLYANNNDRNLDYENKSFDHEIMAFNISQLKPGWGQTKGDDFVLTIMKKDDDSKEKVKSALKVLLPSEWETLYNSIDFSNTQDKTLNLEGRAINIKSNKVIMITFGPIRS
jgi:hypothetical protein